MERLIAVIFLFLLCFTLVHNSNPTVNFDFSCYEDRFTIHFSAVENETNPYQINRALNVELLDASCDDKSNNSDGQPRASTGTSNNTVQLNMTVKFDECGSVVYNLTDDMVINNTATLKVTEYLRGGKTKRMFLYAYKMSCSSGGREINFTSSDGNQIRVNNQTINITKEGEKKGQYKVDFSMDFYTDDTFATTHPAGEITVFNSNANIYVRVKEDTPNSQFKFVVTECAADKSTTYNPTTADVFFQDRCSLDPTFQIKSALNATDNFDFEVQVFSFVTETDAVYLHCQIYICLTDSDETECVQSCPSTGNRQRRDTEELGRDRIVTSHLLRFNKTIDCGDLDCPINSKCEPLEPARCICVENYVYSRVEFKCVKERIVQIENVHVDTEWDEKYSDPTNPDFLRLALRYEDLLYQTFIAAETTREIEGVRIIGASPGSIIFETKIIYAPTSTPQKAYNAFVRSIESEALDTTTTRRELKILPDRTPAIVEIKEEMDVSQKIIVIIIAVLLLLIFLIGSILFLVMRRKRRRKKKLDKTAIIPVVDD